jgi:hypothetical protein
MRPTLAPGMNAASQSKELAKLWRALEGDDKDGVRARLEGQAEELKKLALQAQVMGREGLIPAFESAISLPISHSTGLGKKTVT